ncbi:MAG TPA: hypothetical protein VGE18_03395 [Candidatus Paceibacterota bacterium]
MADENEFGGAGEITEEELGDGIAVVTDVDAVDEVDDADVIVDDIVDPLLPKTLLEEDEEKPEEEIDPEEEAYFFGDKYDER